MCETLFRDPFGYALLCQNYPTEGIVVVEKQSVKYKLLFTRHYDENVM